MVDYRQPFQQPPPEGTLRQSDYKTSFQAKKGKESVMTAMERRKYMERHIRSGIY